MVVVVVMMMVMMTGKTGHKRGSTSAVLWTDPPHRSAVHIHNLHNDRERCPAEMSRGHSPDHSRGFTHLFSRYFTPSTSAELCGNGGLRPAKNGLYTVSKSNLSPSFRWKSTSDRQKVLHLVRYRWSTGGWSVDVEISPHFCSNYFDVYYWGSPCGSHKTGWCLAVRLCVSWSVTHGC